ncbi:MAG: DUF1801 domain-containing protein [Pseudomonadota bacterium]
MNASVSPGSESVDAYLSALPPDQRDALTALRARLKALLPDHLEVMSYAMPGFRQPGSKGKMVVGYAAFSKHLGLYPHSGSIIPQIDCTPFKTSKSGVLTGQCSKFLTAVAISSSVSYCTR